MKQLKLLAMRKWLNEPVMTLECARSLVAEAQSICVPFGFVKKTSPQLATLLDSVPQDYREWYDGEQWQDKTTLCQDSAHLTVHLAPDVEVIDDTQPEKSEHDFLPVVDQAGRWMFQHDGYREVLRTAIDLTRYLCCEVRDTNGKVGYLPCWFGPASQFGAETIEQCAAGDVLDVVYFQGPLTPTRVVFKGEGHE